MELSAQFESAMKNTSVEGPNLYIVAHGNSPSKTITISKKSYEYNDSNYMLTILPGFILVVFTPENMQQWGSSECLQPDLEAFNSEWYKTDHIFSKYAKVYNPGDTYLNMCLQFERAKYFNAYNVYDSNPYMVKKGKKTSQFKGLFGNKQFTLQNLLDELYKHKSATAPTQVIYLMACNPYPVTIDDTIEETNTSHIAIKEHADVTKLRRTILQAGRDTFNILTPSTKVKWTGSVRKQEKTDQLNIQHLNRPSHPYFTLTSNSVVNHETFREHEEKDAEKGTIAALAGLLAAKRTEKVKSKVTAPVKSKVKAQVKGKSKRQSVKQRNQSKQPHSKKRKASSNTSSMELNSQSTSHSNTSKKRRILTKSQNSNK